MVNDTSQAFNHIDIILFGNHNSYYEFEVFMDIKKKIGRRIKEIRKSRGLSQEKLSEMVDIAQNTLSYIETGDNFFTADTLEKIINALEIEPDELFNFGQFKNNAELIKEINSILNKNPEKIPEFYKILKAMTN